MTKLIFFIFIFFCSLQSFSQKLLYKAEFNNTSIENSVIAPEVKFHLSVSHIEMTENKKDAIIEKSICNVLLVEVSDLFNADMLKKFTAQV